MSSWHLSKLRHLACPCRTRLSDFTFTFHFHALEKKMATHSSILAWRIPGTEEPGGLPSMGSHRVGHDWRDLAAAAETWLLLLLPTRVLGLLINRNWSEARKFLASSSIEIDQRPDKKFRGSNTNNSFLCLLTRQGGASLFFTLVRVGIGWKRWLRWFAHPFVVLCTGGQAQYPAFVQALQKWQLGLLISLYLLSRISPNCACMQLFSVSCFFVFCCLRRDRSRCKHCSTAAKGPSFLPVPLLLN